MGLFSRWNEAGCFPTFQLGTEVTVSALGQSKAAFSLCSERASSGGTEKRHQAGGQVMSVDAVGFHSRHLGEAEGPLSQSAGHRGSAQAEDPMCRRERG